LGAEGIAVAVNYRRRADQADAVVDSICRAGGQALAVQADVCDANEVEALVEQVTAQLGAPTLLVNSATAELEHASANALTWPMVLQQLEFQVKAVLETCQRVYPAMQSAGGGAIVNVVSQVVDGPPPPNLAAYVCAKHALVGLSKALAVEWAADRIRVNMVSPGLTRTDLTQHYNERVFKLEASRVPLRRLCEPTDVARVVAFLLSDQAQFLTGINLPITGGLSMT
jgi:3-oxoacyl-[acyl-carrier protein] reductase